jgi:hypothetical protein
LGQPDHTAFCLKNFDDGHSGSTSGGDNVVWDGPQMNTEIRDLIRRMSLVNPLWGAARNDWLIVKGPKG